jgi:hypothetical protein
MKSEDQVLAALQALAAHDREREAPDHIETHVRAAFRGQQKRRPAKLAAIWSLAAAAVAAAVFLGLPRERPAPVVNRTPPQLAEVTPPVVAVVEAPAPQKHPDPRKATPSKATPKRPREVATEFFPLMDVPLPFERGELLRVIVPASTMRRVGLPVNEDRLAERVQADVLVGEEGLARAIRFVRYEQ